jgi:hypothetical protein
MCQVSAGICILLSHGMAKKNRIEIPAEIAADILFRSNRTCCVCREKKPVQIHHVDENPANYSEGNLAILCFDCHRDTQIRGGFDRKLDSAQIRRYRDDWLTRVANKREREHGPLSLQPQPRMQETRVVKYVQIKENSDEHSYSIEAEFPQFSSDDPTDEEQLNGRISTFITGVVDDFRSTAIARSREKIALRQELSRAGWDSLSVAHKISLLSPDYLSIEFVFQTYGAGAAHPNSATTTLNFRLRPFSEIELRDLFKPSSNYLLALSEFCINELHSQQLSRWHNPDERAEELKARRDDWICSGAAPVESNFNSFVLVNEGITIFFDAYKVGSYAEGRYEVFIPFHSLQSFLSGQIEKVLP